MHGVQESAAQDPTIKYDEDILAVWKITRATGITESIEIKATTRMNPPCGAQSLHQNRLTRLLKVVLESANTKEKIL